MIQDYPKFIPIIHASKLGFMFKYLGYLGYRLGYLGYLDKKRATIGITLLNLGYLGY